MIIFTILLSITTAFVYFYTYKQLKKIKRMNQIRNTIARDLHDDIGATLSSISFYAQAIKQRIEQNKLEEADSILNQMSSSARQTVESMSDIVWLVNPTNDSLENLTKKIEDYSNKILLSKNINFKFIKEIQNANTMDVLLRRDLFLICKEAINNAVKYSEADKIEIYIKLKNKNLTIDIIDNGKGFSLKEEKSGNGILNMKVRAANLKANFTIHSELTKGTKIQLECPI